VILENENKMVYIHSRGNFLMQPISKDEKTGSYYKNNKSIADKIIRKGYEMAQWEAVLKR